MEENTVPSVFDELAAEPQRIEYASTGQRFANLIIDSLVYYAFIYILATVMAIVLIFSGMAQEDVTAILSKKLFGYVFGLLIYLLVYTIIEGWSKGRTVGKLITKTVVVKQDFSPITWNEAVTRSLVRLIPFDAFTGLGGTPLHDSITKTTVIKKIKLPA